MAERLIGAIMAAVFVVPTVVIMWLAVNIEAAHISHFVSTDLFLATAVLAVVFGFAFPRLIPDLLGRLWHWLYGYARWW